MAAAISAFVISGVLLVLAGCAYTQPVILRHPQTGETVQCGPYEAWFAYAKEWVYLQEWTCIDHYVRRGYEYEQSRENMVRVRLTNGELTAWWLNKDTPVAKLKGSWRGPIPPSTGPGSQAAP